MSLRNERELRNLWREHNVQCYDEASDDEIDQEEIEEATENEEDADEDSDFDYRMNQMSEEESDDELVELNNTQEKRIRQRRTILKGRNKYKWSINPPNRQERFTKETRSSSLKNEARNIKTPLEAWSLLFDDKLLEAIVKHTNEEIDQRNQQHEDQRCFKSISLIELKAFLGLLYFIGLHKSSYLPVSDLWSAEFGKNLCRAVMSEHRFSFLLGCLRFDDRNTRRERKILDILAPIRDIWNSFIYNCQKYYSPSTNCSIDSQLLPFRGRFKNKIYAPKKLDRYGIKIFMCNDVQTSYMINAEPYIGKVKADESEQSYYVKKLTEPIHNSNYNITCDNWFMSAKLAQELKSTYSLTVIAILKKNRPEIPSNFTRIATTGTARYAYANGLVLLSYHPKKNKVVMLLSSTHEVGKVDEESGNPQIVEFYKNTIGATATFDQLCKLYTTSRITNRWPMRIFHGMLDQSGMNAFILYNLKANNEALNRRNFLKQLITALVKPQMEYRLQIASLQKYHKDLIMEILKIEVPQRKERLDKLHKRKRCRVCPSKNDRKTSYCCTNCEKPICEEHRIHYCYDCAH